MISMAGQIGDERRIDRCVRIDLFDIGGSGRERRAAEERDQQLAVNGSNAGWNSLEERPANGREKRVRNIRVGEKFRQDSSRAIDLPRQVAPPSLT